MHRFLVLAAARDHLSQIRVRGFFGTVRNQARNLGSRFSCEVRTVAGSAFCFVDGGAVIGGPGKVGQNEEQRDGDHRDQDYELRYLHDCFFLSEPYWSRRFVGVKQENLADDVREWNKNVLIVMQFLRNRGGWSVIAVTPGRDRGRRLSASRA